MCHTALMNRHVRQNSQSVHPTHGPSNEGNRVSGDTLYNCVVNKSLIIVFQQIYNTTISGKLALRACRVNPALEPGGTL